MKGTYVIVTELKKDTKMKIGDLGDIIFPQGYYCYVGSALGESVNLENRIGRHKKLNKDKKGNIHWHIDYFLVNPNVQIIKTYSIQSGKRLECKVSNMMERFAKDLVHSFGCSDCKCKSHFFFFTDNSYENVFEKIKHDQLKTLIVYESVQNPDTKIIAETMGGVLGAEVVRPHEINIKSISDYDIIGFGSGIYRGKHNENLLKLIDKIPTLKNKKVFVFSTCADPMRWLYHRTLKGKLEEKDANIIDEFSSGQFNIFRAANDGRIDHRYSEKSKKFAKSLKKKF